MTPSERRFAQSGRNRRTEKEIDALRRREQVIDLAARAADRRALAEVIASNRGRDLLLRMRTANG